jgi:peptidoglycan/LPS O-acetylase OafA/YrhL
VTPSYRPDIDGLRAFSVIAVLIYHAFPSVLSGGFVGVDIFFVISGYLISLIISREIENSVFSFGGFYRRRLQRIVPALIPVLLGSLAIGWFVMLPDEYTALGKHVTAASTFVSNFVFWNESGYFDIDREFKPLLHLWSLAVEEQFYLIWPLVVVAGHRFGMRPLLLLLISCSFFSGVAFVEADRASIFFLPHYRAWELLLGASMVWFGGTSSGKWNAVSRIFGELASFVGITVLIVSVVLFDEFYGEPGWPGWWTILPTSGAVLIILAGSKVSINRWILGNRFMVGIGKISYPLYLWHWPLLSFARIIESGEPSVSIRLAILLLSFVLAWASYQFVEKPLRYRKGLGVPIILIASLVSLGLTGLFIGQQKGLPSREEAFEQSVSNFNWAARMNTSCPEEFVGDGTHCTTNGRPHSIAVLGDSHSINLFYALAHHYADTEIGVQALGKAGCPPLYGIESPALGQYDCEDATNAGIDYVVREESIGTVYLVSWGQYVPPEDRIKRIGPRAAEYANIFRTGMENTIVRLLAANKEVVVVIDWPKTNFNPRSCLSIRPVKPFGELKTDCYMPKKFHIEERESYRELLYNLSRKFPSIKYWDTSTAFCDDQICRVKDGNKVLYSSRDHLSVEGAKYLGCALKLERF